MAKIRWDSSDPDRDSSGITTDSLGDHSGAIEQGYEHGSLTKGLVAYYKMDEGSGTTTADSALDNTGSISGSTWVSGKVGSNALGTAGGTSGDKIQATHQNHLNLSVWTASLWVKFDVLATGSWQGVFCKGTGKSPDRNYALFQRPNDNGLHYSFWRTDSTWASYDSVATLTTGTWYHITQTFDGSNYILYIDGSVDNNAAESGTPDATAQDLYIGNVPDYNGTDGTIDEFRLYDRALSAPEVASLSNLTQPSIVSPEDTLL